ncbi:hypothetical protein DIPPA_22239 [Diplonema papillatum]|nr:hypothetical protein DIPPA_22239 [Diplonema papillatum]
MGDMMKFGGVLPHLDEDGNLQFDDSSVDMDFEDATVREVGENAMCWVGVADSTGARDSMEDAFMLSLSKRPECSSFGVFDGHGGKGCSAFISQSLKQAIEQAPEGPPQTDEQVEKLCLRMDGDFLKVNGGINGRVLDASGSTGAFGFLRPLERVGAHAQDKQKYSFKVGSVGDSRVLVHRKGKLTKSMTTDHKPDIPEEVERIKSAGGWVIRNRVDGKLAVSRAFGDTYFKQGTCDYTHKIIAVPTITDTILEPGDIIVITCDGIFETGFKDDEVIDIVKEVLNASPETAQSLGEAARILCDKALESGSSDNCTAIVARVKDPDVHPPITSSPPLSHAGNSPFRSSGTLTAYPAEVLTIPPASSRRDSGNKLDRERSRGEGSLGSPASPNSPSGTAHFDRATGRASLAGSVKVCKSPTSKGSAHKRGAETMLHLLLLHKKATEASFGFRLLTEAEQKEKEKECDWSWSRIGHVTPSSPAWRAWMRPGMSLVAIAGKQVTCRSSFSRMFKKLDAEEKTMAVLIRANAPAWARIRREQVSRKDKKGKHAPVTSPVFHKRTLLPHALDNPKRGARGKTFANASGDSIDPGGSAEHVNGLSGELAIELVDPMQDSAHQQLSAPSEMEASGLSTSNSLNSRTVPMAAQPPGAAQASGTFTQSAPPTSFGAIMARSGRNTRRHPSMVRRSQSAKKPTSSPPAPALQPKISPPPGPALGLKRVSSAIRKPTTAAARPERAAGGANSFANSCSTYSRAPGRSASISHAAPAAPPPAFGLVVRDTAANNSSNSILNSTAKSKKKDDPGAKPGGAKPKFSKPDSKKAKKVVKKTKLKRHPSTTSTCTDGV